ncbi:MAG: hypothetical protein AB1758_12280 [Candidatus Eremiobacterota bacterium]
MKVLILLLALLLAQDRTVAERGPALGLAASLGALALVWGYRSGYLPAYLPADLAARLRDRSQAPVIPRPEPPAEVAPPPESVTAEAPPEPASAPEPDLFDPSTPPEPQPPRAPDPADLVRRWMEAQGEFELGVSGFVEQAQEEWSGLERFLRGIHARYQAARAELEGFLDSLGEERDGLVASSGVVLRADPEVGAVPLTPCAVAEPLDPPAELDAEGWGEPNAEGVRSRLRPDPVDPERPPYHEFLGPPNDPGQPASSANPRPYYSERQVDGFREIVRGAVAGRTFTVHEQCRWVDPDSLAQGDPREVRLTPSRSVKIWGPGDIEPILWTLPAGLRERVPDLVLAPDPGGPVDWAGRYRVDREGRAVTFSSLVGPGRVALRTDLLERPVLLRAVLEDALGVPQPSPPEPVSMLVDGELVYLDSDTYGVLLAFPALRSQSGTSEGVRWTRFELLPPGPEAARARLGSS